MDKELTQLNKLIARWPKGTVFTLTALKKEGYYMQLMDRYKKGQWIESIGFGAYKRYQDQIDWFGGVYALQHQLLYKIHAGGKTSLQLHGYAHYLSEYMVSCYLFSEQRHLLPKWFKNYNWDVTIIFKLGQLFNQKFDIGFTDYAHKEFSIKISAPERAILEMLYLVPGTFGFDESYRIMENLTTLRPAVVQELLENCYSIKTKRLFMYMAEKAGHSWLDRVNTDHVDFGSGKRAVVENGVLDKKYNITVPRDFK